MKVSSGLRDGIIKSLAIVNGNCSSLFWIIKAKTKVEIYIKRISHQSPVNSYGTAGLSTVEEHC